MSGVHNPQLDGILDWTSTFAALIAAYPSPQFPVGTQAFTTDMGSVRWTGTNWEMDIALDGQVAHAGGGQALGTLIAASMVRFATVATAGDSATLPASKPGMNIIVTNATAATSMNVFPNPGGTGTEAINALGANAAFALGGGKSVTFICYTSGLWHTVPLVP